MVGLRVLRIGVARPAGSRLSLCLCACFGFEELCVARSCDSLNRGFVFGFGCIEVVLCFVGAATASARVRLVLVGVNDCSLAGARGSDCYGLDCWSAMVAAAIAARSCTLCPSAAGAMVQLLNEGVCASFCAACLTGSRRRCPSLMAREPSEMCFGLRMSMRMAQA